MRTFLARVMMVPENCVRTSSGGYVHYRPPDPLNRNVAELLGELAAMNIAKPAIGVLRYHMPQRHDLFLALSFALVHGPDATTAILADGRDGLQAIWAWDMHVSTIMRMVLNGRYEEAVRAAALAGVRVSHSNAGGFSALEYAVAAADIADVPDLVDILHAEDDGLLSTRTIRIIVRRGSLFAVGCLPLLEAMVARGGVIHIDDVDDVMAQLHRMALGAARQNVHISSQSDIVGVVRLVLSTVTLPFATKLELKVATPVWFIHAIFMRFANSFGMVAFNLFRLYSLNQFRILSEALAVEYRGFWCRSVRKCLLIRTFFDYTLAEFRVARQLNQQSRADPSLLIHGGNLVCMAKQYCNSSIPVRLTPWSGHRHHLYPPNYRDMVRVLFMCANRYAHAHTVDVSVDVLGVILKFCHRYDYRFGCYVRPLE